MSERALFEKWWQDAGRFLEIKKETAWIIFNGGIQAHIEDESTSLMRTQIENSIRTNVFSDPSPSWEPLKIQFMSSKQPISDQVIESWRRATDIFENLLYAVSKLRQEAIGYREELHGTAGYCTAPEGMTYENDGLRICSYCHRPKKDQQ